MIKQFIETFRKPSAAVLAQRELEDAKRSLLEAHSQREYWESLVRCNQNRVTRLAAYITDPQR